MDALGKRRNCSLVHRWSRSIINHLYWCAVSSGDNVELMPAKWNSVTNHICNIHEGHSDLYPNCSHESLDDDPREWFTAGESISVYICGVYPVFLIQNSASMK